MDQAIAELFELTFDEDDIVVELADEEVLFTKLLLGSIKTSSGKLMAGDPFEERNDLVLTETFPTGEFPVEAAIAEFDDGEEVVGYVRIVFSPQPPTQWEPAQYTGENAMMSALVASGIFGLADEKVFQHLQALSDEQREAVHNDLHNALDETHEENRAWADLPLNEHNLVVCSSGDGEGTYTSYIGRDADGNICRLVTDFALFEED
uniref:DUF4241 domain-containing protein n=1 Tax=Roseihalotalea indica TaxID=2867963 RepID=A0AA49GI48_9BACT|nr:DUF4241 domain-containing protein [Tunicatimonas sp. TK19036]